MLYGLMKLLRNNVSGFVLTLLLITLSYGFEQSARADLSVLPVIWAFDEGGDPILHSTYNGVATTFKAIARGGDGTYEYEWDFNGDGAYDTPIYTTSNSYDLSASHTYPDQLDNHLFFAKIRVSSGGETVIAQYPVQVHVNPLITDHKVNRAIDDGLWHLHLTMTRDTYPGGAKYGYWSYDINTASCTGAAIEAFEIMGHLPGSDYDSNPYVETVKRGLNYLCNSMKVHTITMQEAGDPDVNGNSIGIGCYADWSHSMYECGITLMTFASSLAPDSIAEVGPDSVIGRPYSGLVQDMIDYLAFGQSDQSTGNYRGGWRYYANYGQSDNSCSQWPVIGMEATVGGLWDSVGVSIPPFVKDELTYWIDYIQNDGSGGSGYMGPDDWVNVAKTGGLLCEMKFYGDSLETPRVQDAVDYILDNWQSDGEHFSVNSYYAFYSIMKGLRLLDIRYLPDNTPSGFDWYYDDDWGYANHLVGIQNADGSWPEGYYSSSYLASAWAILTLLPHPINPPPVAVAKASPTQAPPSAVITFDHSDSYHPLSNQGKYIVEFRWNFNADQDTVWDYITDDINAKPTTQYWDSVECNEPGVEHLVILEVEDNDGLKDQDDQSVVIAITMLNNPPVADGDPSDSDPNYTVSQGGLVLLDASDSKDPDEIITGNAKCDPTAPDDHITAWEWDLDNDGWFDVEGETYLFDTPDDWEVGFTYTVQLRVWDDGTWAGPGGGGQLSDETTVTIEVSSNQPPDCSDAYANPDELWPPNHRFEDIEILGVVDPDGDPVIITITGITQDEPVDAIGNGDGHTSPDGIISDDSTAVSVRAERAGSGNGRVYEILFTASDPAGDECTGSVTVCVPKDQRPGHECLDDGQDYDSTQEIVTHNNILLTP